jgi:RHS repeat-associated protein
MVLFLRALYTFVLFILLTLAPVNAQVTTGTPPLGSFGGGPDTVDLANLNVSLTVPVFQRSGRGASFQFVLGLNTSAWYPVPTGSTPPMSWQASNSFGQPTTATPFGYVTHAQTQTTCSGNNHVPLTINSRWVYVDPAGTSHPFAISTWSNTSTPCSTTSQTGTASDNSGYKLSATGSNATQLVMPNGTVINFTTGTAMTLIDRNGNEITTDNSGHYYDTYSSTVPVLTVAGTGTPTSPTTYTYTAPSGASASFTVKYMAYTVQTAFGCSGIGEFGATSKNLISEIDLPDVSAYPADKYTFTYEATPGAPSNVTGRIKSITFPTGGTITYTYTGGSSGHITCADGSAPGLQRATPDSTTPWTYTRTAGSGAAYTTTVTDPQGNQTVIQFQGIYETQRNVYQGSSTILASTNTCYNNSASPCPGTAVTPPFIARTVTTTFPSLLTSEHAESYNSTGALTETDDYDYGAGTPGSLMREVLYTYASLGSNITNFPQQVTVQDGSGTTLALTKYNYDETAVQTNLGTPPQHTNAPSTRGNLTSVNSYINSSAYLTRRATYFDTGMVQTSTDVNGAQSTYNYSSSAATCGFTFPSSVTEPLSMGQSFTWNCTGGVQTSVTDENGHATSTGYTTDPYFWRPNSTTDAVGNTTSLLYSPGSFVSTITFNGGSSEVETGVASDGLGRQSVKNHQHGPGISLWDQVQQTYDSVGRLYQISAPCVSTGALTCPMGPSDHPTTNLYDALGRPTNTSDGEGGTTSYSYTSNDVLVTIGPAPTGENTKRRQMQYDALGRMTSVCEITSLSGSGTCAQNSSATGFWTKYAYGPGNVVTVTQNAQAGAGSQQTRTYNYDYLGRLTSETNPESGTTTYTYDVIPTGCNSAGTSSTGDLVRRQDPAGDNNCFIYDSLHRVTSVSSRTGCKRFAYDNGTVTGSRPSGVNTANSIGRLTEALTDNCSAWPPTPITDEWFSYSARGEVVNLWESTPHSGGYYPVTAAYWPNGPLSSLLGANGYSMTWGIDGEGRISSAGSGGATLSSTTYSAAGQPTQLSFPSGDADNFTYDSTGRMKSYSYTVNGQTLTGNLTWNANGTLASLLTTDPFNSANTQNCTYAHDDLVRIASVNCGASTWQQNFTYDPFGNITKTVPIGGTGNSFQPTYSATTNHISTVGSSSVTYDANGAVTNDSIHTYTWDGFGNATTIDGNGMIYDALDRMVEQNRSANNTEIIYSPTGFKMQIMNGSTATIDFVPLPGGASQVFTLSTVYYRHADWLGSSRLATITTTRARFYDGAYAPFGDPYAQSGTADLSFTGMDSDTSGGLYDFAAREYSTQGRWPRPDPAGIRAASFSDPQTFNRYAYVRNSPMSLTDPSGLSPACRTGCPWTRPTALPSGRGMAWFPDAAMGYDEFDAIEGKPGTYITLNAYGRVGFGFSYDLYLATHEYIEGQNSSTKNIPFGDQLYLTGSGFQVFVTSGAGLQTVHGLLPDLAAADPSGIESQAIATMPPSLRTIYESNINDGMTPGQALFALIGTVTIGFKMSQNAPIDIPLAGDLEYPSMQWADDFLSNLRNLYTPIVERNLPQIGVR